MKRTGAENRWKFETVDGTSIPIGQSLSKSDDRTTSKPVSGVARSPGEQKGVG